MNIFVGIVFVSLIDVDFFEKKKDYLLRNVKYVGKRNLIVHKTFKFYWCSMRVV